MPSSVVDDAPLTTGKSASRGPGGRFLERLDPVVAGLTIVLGFLPYAAVNLGSSTNVPLSSLLCWYLVARCLGHRDILWTTLVLVSGPFVATALRLLLAPHYLAVAPYVTWVFYVIPATGMAASLLILRHRALPILSLSIAVSSAFAIVQKYFFSQGTIPWLWYYSRVKGYAPVEAIVDPRFNPRVMGLFPEPSVMAGSLVMAMMLMVLLAVRQGQGYSWRELLAVGLGVPALLMSASGSVVPTLGVLVLCALIPVVRRNAWILVGAPVLMLVAVQASTGILAERTGRFNWSWVDRTSSILIGVERWVADPVSFLFGIGRGMSTYYFEHGLMPTSSHPHYNPLVDMFTVTGRIAVENGLLVGGVILAVLARPFLSTGVREGAERAIALGALLVWVIVATATISYDSAFWIFGLPGGMLGAALLARAETRELASVPVIVPAEQMAPGTEPKGGKAEGVTVPRSGRERLRLNRRRRRIWQSAVATLGVFLLLVPTLLYRVVMHPRTAAPHTTDAVVVLGPSTKARTDLAERLMRSEYAKALVVSAHPSDTPGVRPSPCEQARPYPVYCFDPDPATTQGEARALRRLAAEHDWKSVQVITFAPQAERARMLVRRCYPGEVSMIDSRELFDSWDQYFYQSGAFIKALLVPGC